VVPPDVIKIGVTGYDEREPIRGNVQAFQGGKNHLFNVGGTPRIQKQHVLGSNEEGEGKRAISDYALQEVNARKQVFANRRHGRSLRHLADKNLNATEKPSLVVCPTPLVNTAKSQSGLQKLLPIFVNQAGCQRLLLAKTGC
jgi:hypothetical protein